MYVMPVTSSNTEENPRFPRRAKRKAVTRTKLLEAATALFQTKGYDDTTLEEIAQSAGLHVQTLYRHFPTKQELALAQDYQWLERFTEKFADRPDDQSTFAFWREWIDGAAVRLSADGGASFRRHLAMQQSCKPLLGSIWNLHTRYEDILARGFCKDFGVTEQSSSIPRLAAGSLLSSNAYVLRRFAQEEIDLRAEAVALIDAAEAVFTPRFAD